MTKGEYRVGITFNPSNDDMAGRIKRAAADLIDMIEGILDITDYPQKVTDAEWERDQEVRRLKALAQTAIEEGAMWAVKAATKGPMA